MIFAIGIATFFSTLLGGLFALRLRDKLHLILGFSAGAVVGVAFFDLMPEALELGGSGAAAQLIALGFLLYLLLDRFILLHTHDEGDSNHDTSHGTLGASSLSLHSFLDGLGIGLAFKVSPAVGAIAALAVLTHDFSDGINTVNVVLRHGGDRRRALKWLLTDAITPLLGIASTLFFSVPEQTLGLLLALFCGFFLYIGAADLVPESQHVHPKRLTTLMTLLGAAVLFGIIKLASL